MTTVREQIKELQDLDPDDEIACPLWSTADVMGYCRQNKIAMDDATARDIVNTMDRKHDAEYGITWITLECAIDYADNKPIFFKAYWRDEDGDVLGYECEPLRTAYFMLQDNGKLLEDHAFELGLRFLQDAGIDIELSDKDDFWTITELEPDDEIWELFKDYDEDAGYVDGENKMWDLLTSPIVLWVDGKGIPHYVTPRCPECGEVLESVDEVYQDMKTYTWDHDKNAIITSKHIGEPITDHYECPECCADISDYFYQFDVTWNL